PPRRLRTRPPDLRAVRGRRHRLRRRLGSCDRRAARRAKAGHARPTPLRYPASASRRHAPAPARLGGDPTMADHVSARTIGRATVAAISDGVGPWAPQLIAPEGQWRREVPEANRAGEFPPE